jgi:hypothetical protein
MTASKRDQERSLINIRRARIATLLAQGFTSQQEIASSLHISDATVSRDIDFLKQEAQRNLKQHLELRIPHQYSLCETGLKIVLRRAFEIANNPNNTTSESIQSLNLIANIYGRLMELSTDEKTIAQAVSWIEKKKQQLMDELRMKFNKYNRNSSRQMNRMKVSEQDEIQEQETESE